MVDYLKSINSGYFVDWIREMAKESLKYLPDNSPARKEAKLRAKRPVDYLRCAEFPIVFRHMGLKNGGYVLDVGSPQWFSLLLAKENSRLEFFYLNILKDEIDSVKDIAEGLGIKNLHFVVGDVKNMGFPSSFFDHVISISVMEHIFPERGGDFFAFEEIKRVLKPEGKITISIPLKDRPRIIYMKGKVYERKEKGRKFFAREYGVDDIRIIAEKFQLEVVEIDFIIEKKGVFALDYWRWGNGRKNPARFLFLGLIKFIEKIGFFFEEKIANYYLYSSERPEKGVICAVITFKNKGEI